MRGRVSSTPPAEARPVEGRKFIGALIFIPFAGVFGCVSDLIGPWFGRFFSIAAFIATLGVFLGLESGIRNGKIVPALGKSAIERWMPLASILVLLGGIALFLVIGSATMNSHPGGVANDQPIFAMRDEYVLNNHGTRTVVSRAEYVKEGVRFTLGWHSVMLFFAGVTAHYACFGCRPFGKPPRPK